MSSDRTLNDTPEREPDSPTLNLQDANTSQLTPTQKDKLMALFGEYRDIFAVNPGTVDACGGPPMILDLKASKSKPHVTPIRNYTPEQRKMIQDDIKKWWLAALSKSPSVNTPRPVIVFVGGMGQRVSLKSTEIQTRCLRPKAKDWGVSSRSWMK